ncbi:MAG: glycosyltransferase [Candidatus Tritonobacter lacicola]|nr:glycosyltransferase [Candidatus Tritonobacter lacicola]
MTDSNDYISVVMPTRDRKGMLEKCLEAYANQSLPREHYEIIVIDDGSTDGTRELLENASEKIANLRHFSQPKRGPAKARNLGIESAGGPIILFAGDDCIPDKNLLREHLRMHRRKEAIAVLGHIDWHQDLKLTPFMKFLAMDTQFSYPRIKKLAEDVPFYYFYTSNISMSKEYIEKAGAFDEEFTKAVYEDVELGYRIWKSGLRIVYNSRAIAYHDHETELKDYIKRQVRCGKAAALLYKKHPELLALLRVPRVSSPEIRYRFYQAVLDYCFYAGLQGGLETKHELKGLISLENRLKNWSDIEKDRLMKTVLALEDRMDREIRSRDQSLMEKEREIHKRDRVIERLNGDLQKQHMEIQKQAGAAQEQHKELKKRDELIETLNRKNQEKYYRIVELEKLEIRLKSSLPYRIYGMLRKLTRSRK